jgi:ADP-ribose pyrophosphatase YjhB (NUDIX family)
MPQRRVVLARELTKKFEEYLRGQPAELVEIYKKRSAKGEFVVMIEPPQNAEPALVSSTDSSEPREALYEHPIATVGALIFNREGQVLMLRTHKWSGLWGIPGGKPKFGESSEDALRREIKEETNLDIDQIEFALVQDCIHSTEFYRDAHFVLLNYTCRAIGSNPVQLNDEAEEFQWLSPSASLQIPLNQPTRTLIETVLSNPKSFLPAPT